MGGSLSFLKRPVDAVVMKSQDIMRFVAVNEILLGPTIVFMIFSSV